MSGTVLVLGGRSEIGLAVARRLIGSDNSTVLAARRSDDLDEQEAALRRAGATEVGRVEFDADDLARHRPVLDEVIARHGPLDVVVVAFGILGDQQRAETDAAHAAAVVHTDYLAHVHLLTEVVNVLREQGHGKVVVFSSVAGIRVRRANYVYGSAKAGLDGFAGGLADALHGSGIGLLLVRPGFVIGRMTEGMKPAPFSSTPDQVADATVAALRRGRGEVWVPAVLRPVFFVMRLLPRTVWRRLPR
ncbi:SDR family NAD(P)-dependent oxidoreductase [Amycolatopsis acidiphila]|uniref:SDR family NAD(P)-dependent oxidoreductase n=1 Tax=Amycolatopsis acidiphila TaxID=715473 RepID=A0A558A8P3_9PSEU|nr:SDR family NAD(P)-dependent oxidoreductase [Amycolatopsis acidiphila]TVT20629.1 SDR family NAD(P)-dependent oxidoreductase [Amycolatopsis acidiphila]UIJ61373.1 SDR family NAD(P)-dependent oxidoreductase [Amycolatopsis acidiphila]GHG77987.1 short-chain dehydrogenase [Amycolatopsis acidiphila]